LAPKEDAYFDGIVLTPRTENYKSKYENVEFRVKHVFTEFALEGIFDSY
jgi:hypothetical protein